MDIFQNVEKNLQERGYSVRCFESGKAAAEYLDTVIDNTSVGIGGSATVRDTGVVSLLEKHNRVFWHWTQEQDEARRQAMLSEVYLCSVNALTEAGEMFNMDGRGNRVASTLFGHKKLYLLIGKNKLVKSYEDAVWRTRNIASPRRAQQMQAKTPCAAKGDRCYDCKSPGRICRGLVTLYAPMFDMDVEVLLINEDLGL